MEWIQYNRTPEGSDPGPNDLGKYYSFNIIVRQPNGQPVGSSDGRLPLPIGTGVEDFSQEMFDSFIITIDQLEGEITLPYFFIREPVFAEDGSMIEIKQRIEVPRSQLGGFAQFRINYQYLDSTNDAFYGGEDITPRVLIPRRPFIPPPPPPPVVIIDENQIKEALADKIYEKFFNSELIQGSLEDIKSFQTTVSPTGVGYSTGRQSDDEQLIFFKKDRNTPQNQLDFDGDGSDGIQAIANDIRDSFENTDANGIIDLSEKLDNEISIQEVVSTARIPSSEPPPGLTQEQREDYIPLYIEGTEVPLYYVENIKYNLVYTSDFSGQIFTVEFASFNRFFELNEGDERYQENGLPKRDQWLNRLNLSQLTKPVAGTKADVDKARNLLDTSIFELLPNQSQRQNEINDFFQRFQRLIGNKPTFEDVDGDGAGESMTPSSTTQQLDSRISTAPQANIESSYITRLNEEADASNQNKTLQSMRDELNEYLGDVDNVIEEFEELPEYENKSQGFLKIRNHNQSIIIRNDTDIMPLLKEKTVTRPIVPAIIIGGGAAGPPETISSVTYTGPSWQVEGFTITMWVRFLNTTTGGSLMTYGNPMLKQLPGFRLDTHTRSDYNPSNGFTTNRRMVRLVVWEKTISGEGAIYDSHVGRDFDPNPDGRGVKYQTWEAGANPAYEEFAAMEDGSWHVFMQHTQIPTDDLNEWFFICATYDPTIDEEGSFDQVSFFRDTDFWLNKKRYDGTVTANSGFGNKCKVEVISRTDLLTARGFRV